MTAAEIATYLAAAKVAYLQCLATGAASMSIAGKTTTFRDPEALLRMINQLETQLAGVNAGAIRPAGIRYEKAV